MSQRKSKSQGDVSITELENTIKECVRYIISREGSKIPIKRGEIIKHLTTYCQSASSQIKSIIIETNKILKQVYGFKLIQVESKGGIQYIVVLNEECKSLPSTATNPLHKKLLIAALTHIFMSGGPVKDDEMWKFLSEAGLLEETDHNGRKILTNLFTKQLYLTYNKVGEGELARYIFEWGQRAIEEVPKMFILKKMAEAFDKNVDHWCEQHKQALEERSEEIQ